jgi:hypothetical membrane protein
MTTAKTSGSRTAELEIDPSVYPRQKIKWTMSGSKIPAFAGIEGPIIVVLADLISISANPNHNPLVDSVSEHVLDPLRWLQTLTFYLFGIFETLFAWGLRQGIENKRGFGPAITFLVITGICVFLIGFVHTDAPGQGPTLEKEIHVYLVKIVALLFPGACFLLAPSMKHDTRWRGFFYYTMITGLIGLSLTVWRIKPVSQWIWLGLHERVLVLNAMLWMGLAAIRLLKIQRHRTRGNLGHI